MAGLRIRIKVGEHEFEGDGPHEIVQTELAAFKKMIGIKGQASPAEEKPATGAIEKISRVNGRVVSLKRPPEHPSHGVLAIMLGQQLLRKNTSVKGSEIMDGLRASGYEVSRADIFMRWHIADANVTVSGTHRRRRYILTNRGVEKAQEVARMLAALPEETKK